MDHLLYYRLHSDPKVLRVRKDHSRCYPLQKVHSGRSDLKDLKGLKLLSLLLRVHLDPRVQKPYYPHHSALKDRSGHSALKVHSGPKALFQLIIPIYQQLIQ
jgi:hypothetical protein